MSRNSVRRLALAGLFVVVLVVPVLAEVVLEREAPASNADGSAPASYRTVTSGAEESQTTLAAQDPQSVRGDPTLVVAPRFSVAGATATVEVWLYSEPSQGTYTFMGIADVQTLTASTIRRAGPAGDYLVNSPLLVPTYGAAQYDVRITAVSSGTCKVLSWTLGASSRAGE